MPHMLHLHIHGDLLLTAYAAAATLRKALLLHHCTHVLLLCCLAVCPPGTFQTVTGNTRACTPCTVGSFCPGGDQAAKTPAANLGVARACNAGGSDGLTTKAERSTKLADCGEYKHTVAAAAAVAWRVTAWRYHYCSCS
jgi:hypothetical protein